MRNGLGGLCWIKKVKTKIFDKIGTLKIELSKFEGKVSKLKLVVLRLRWIENWGRS